LLVFVQAFESSALIPAGLRTIQVFSRLDLLDVRVNSLPTTGDLLDADWPLPAMIRVGPREYQLRTLPLI